jgi:hypothetical protein
VPWAAEDVEQLRSVGRGRQGGIRGAVAGVRPLHSSDPKVPAMVLLDDRALAVADVDFGVPESDQPPLAGVDVDAVADVPAQDRLVGDAELAENFQLACLDACRFGERCRGGGIVDDPAGDAVAGEIGGHREAGRAGAHSEDRNPVQRLNGYSKNLAGQHDRPAIVGSLASRYLDKRLIVVSDYRA